VHLWPLVLYGGLVVLVVAGMLGASAVLGERHREPETDDPYESGIISTGSARLRFSPRFYLVAMFFVIFDLESAFVYAWAVAARRAGWLGFFEVVTFIGILLVTLVYLLGVGALDYGPRARLGTRTRERL
jgi:NADH-quinone oxidoreductase subunit A